jgi:hypothetical protein
VIPSARAVALLLNLGSLGLVHVGAARRLDAVERVEAVLDEMLVNILFS